METKQSISKHEVPDVIAHRGYSSDNIENTMLSYTGAIHAHTTALEGDIRMTKDGEIIMMHDASLNRITTGQGIVYTHNWKDDVDKLTTKKDGNQRIARFRDVLDMLIQPDIASRDGFYMIVDIKYDNPIEILDVLSTLIESYTEEHPQLYSQLVIGIWNIDFLSKARTLFPKHKLCFIGLSLSAARKHFLDSVDCVSLPFAALADTEGQAFIKQVHDLNKRIFTWTINDPAQMKMCVSWGVDGVIGDNVKLLLEIVHELPNTLLEQRQYDEFIKSNMTSMSKRSQLYYYLLKKLMQAASWKFIGV
ncbi:PLC-like phosphodiesterase [Pilobolus umbonatus]|nr:PLC-like phosphodiesterase [Pilobolus umbonatus]